MDITVKLLNGTLVALSLDAPVTTDRVAAALTLLDPVMFPASRVHVSALEDAFLAVITPPPTECVIGTYAGLYRDDSYLKGSNPISRPRPICGTAVVGLDLFEPSCCTLEIRVYATIRIEITSADYFHAAKAVDRTRFQADFIRLLSSDGVSRFGHPARLAYEQIRNKPNLVALFFRPDSSMPSGYGYGACLFDDSSYLHRHAPVYPTLREALAQTFRVFLPYERDVDNLRFPMITAYAVDGTALHGEIELTYTLTEEEVDRLLEIAAKEFAWSHIALP